MIVTEPAHCNCSYSLSVFLYPTLLYFFKKNIFMLFAKEHLAGNYKWASVPEDSLFNGSPTRRLFDRWNGVQVLFIINSFGALSESFSIEEGRKVERLINNDLPQDTKSEMSVYNWLRIGHR
jgi:hypothetical protein